MPNQRVFLLFALLFVAFLLWQQWELEQRDPPSAAQPVAQGDNDTSARVEDTDVALPAEDVPDVDAGDIPAAPAQVQSTAPLQPADEKESRHITVVTDVLKVVIDTRGGTIVHLALLDYPVQRKEPDNLVRLMYEDESGISVVQSGLQATEQRPAPDHRSMYSSERFEYELDGRQEGELLEVPLIWQSDDGVQVIKRYVFEAGSYAIQVTHQVRNESGSTWTGRQYRQLQRTGPTEEEANPGYTDPARFSYRGAAWYSPEEKYSKLSFDDMIEDGDLDVEVAGGWVAMVQHYFVSAWVPEPEDESRFYSLVRSSETTPPRFTIGAASPFLQVAPGETGEFRALLFSGPKLQNLLPEIAPGLVLTVDYGIFTVISQPLFWILNWIHQVVGNWGWSIILLTVLIKLVFYKLSETQYRSMARMRKLQPRIQTLRERHGDNKQKLQQATMELYREEKVNPLGGCLPILVQIPVFIALYWVLLESVELRQAPFALWLQDLSSPDPYFILPIIMGVSMLASQKLSPTPSADPVQEKVMMALPIVFTVMFAFFQSGLVLYWTTNQLLSLTQQYIITKRIERSDTGKR